MREHEVVVVGGGPTGLMLAAELALAGVDVVVVERRATPVLAGSRAGGLHARSIEVLDQRGIADRFLAEGQVVQIVSFANVALDISGFPSRHAYTLGLWQNHIERLLGEWVDGLPVAFVRGRAVTGLAQVEDGVDVALSDGTSLRAQYLVGCDGGRSFVRKAAGIGFPGCDPTTSAIIGEVELRDEPEWGMRRTALGPNGISRVQYEVVDGEIVYADEGPIRVMVSQEPGRTGEPTLEDLSDALVSVYGTDFGVHDPTWLSRFSDVTRQADAYRASRVLLAGDAAHVHSPMGGQGLNTGLQDAVNLGWKLARVVSGEVPNAMLDSYHEERHPVGAQVLRLTMTQVLLGREDERSRAAAATVGELVAMDEPRRHLGALLSGLGIHYDLGEGHPLLGRRMPDLDLASGRVYALLHEARPVLLDLGAGDALDAGPWSDRVRLVADAYDGPWELPALGTVPAPAAVLIRPDGHVAWVGDGTAAGLENALTRWFGPAGR